jgi:hypothetical protein
MDRRLISISLQFDQFAGRGVDRGADLFLASTSFMIHGPEG